MIRELQALCFVIEMKTFARAAKKLRSSTSVISRRISNLESYYNIKLLNRTTRSVSPTEAGEKLYTYAKNITEMLEESKHLLKKSVNIASGTLKVGLPVGLSHYLCSENKLAQFLKENTSIDLRIHNGNYLMHLLNEGYDIVVNCGEISGCDFYSKKIGEWRAIVCASPDYLKKHGTPKTPSELSNHNCLIHLNDDTHRSWTFQQAAKKTSIFVKGNFSISSSVNLKQMALFNVGIACLPQFIILDEIKQGTLIPLLENFEPNPMGLYAIYPSKKYLPKKATVLLEFLEKIMCVL